MWLLCGATILFHCLIIINSIDVHGDRITTELFPSYLDRELWYNTTAKKLTYSIYKHRFSVEKFNVLKFKYDDTAVEEQPSLRRKRRNIFGGDDRYHIKDEFVKKYPFQTAVRLSHGCTGTLVWYQHVLTSAHCVHNRKEFDPPLKELRVGLLKIDGTFEWYGASSGHVPRSWRRKLGMSYLNHDYAIIKLDRPHRRRWMPFGVYDVSMNKHIQLVGFPSDKKDNEMWYSFCTIAQSKKHTFFSYCDATRGMSGSGVYVYNENRKPDRVVVAIFSSYVQFKTKGLQKTFYYDANVATRLTAKKVRRICKWIRAGKNCYRLNPMLSGHMQKFK